MKMRSSRCAHKVGEERLHLDTVGNGSEMSTLSVDMQLLHNFVQGRQQPNIASDSPPHNYTHHSLPVVIRRAAEIVANLGD